MAIQRIITCDICSKTEAEKTFGAGWKGWGQILGKINENGNTEFGLCPEHLEDVMKIAMELKEVLGYGMDKSNI